MIDFNHIRADCPAALKVALHIVAARRDKLAAWLQQRSYVPLTEVCARFEISEATARRDLAALADQKQIRRTHGGALGEEYHRFPSFMERQRVGTQEKRDIAERALKMIEPGMSVFFDGGTTVFAIAEELQRSPVIPLTVITNSIPVAELLAPVNGIGANLLGGELVPRQSVLLGSNARKALDFYEIDLAFMGAEGLNEKGVWNSQEGVVEMQKGIVKKAKQVILCADGSKLGRRAPVFLARWKEIDTLLTDASDGACREAGVVSGA
jgi:DeoR/GlpR family transcriptional regulator of sugar metabolism